MALTIRIGSQEERRKAIAKAAELLQGASRHSGDEEFESLIGAIADYDMLSPQTDNAASQPAAGGGNTQSM